MDAHRKMLPAAACWGQPTANLKQIVDHLHHVWWRMQAEMNIPEMECFASSVNNIYQALAVELEKRRAQS